MQEVINEVNIVDDDGFTLDTISIADTASPVSYTHLRAHET